MSQFDYELQLLLVDVIEFALRVECQVQSGCLMEHIWICWVTLTEKNRILLTLKPITQFCEYVGKQDVTQ